MTSWLPGRWGFLAQRVMWLAEPGKELLNGSKQSSVSMEDVCVCLSVLLCNSKVIKQILSSDCTYSTVQWSLCNYKKYGLSCIRPLFVFSSSCQSLSHNLPSLGCFNKSSCFSVFSLCSSPSWCMDVLHLSMLGPWRPTLTPDGCIMKCFTGLWNRDNTSERSYNTLPFHGECEIADQGSQCYDTLEVHHGWRTCF